MSVAQPVRPLPAKRRLTRKQRRLVLIAAAGAVLFFAAGLVLFAMRDTIVFFYGPTEIVEKGVQPGTRMRLGGLVETGSVQRSGGQRITFGVTDGKTSIKVGYDGLLPDLFREGQGVVTEGVVVGVTPDMTERFDAVALVRVASEQLGGKGGGGRRDMAQAGGPDGSKAQAALDAVAAAMG